MSAYFDRIRGSQFNLIEINGKSLGIERLVYGWVVAALFGHVWSVLTLPIMVLFAIGESWGWGRPLGELIIGRSTASYEWYQKGVLKKPVPALIFRGFLWGAPVALLGYYDSNLLALPIIMAWCMPVAGLMGKLIHNKTSTNASDAWAWQETIRGLLVGVCIAFI